MSDTDARLAAIEQRLARIEEKLDRLLAGPEPTRQEYYLAGGDWPPPSGGYLLAGDSPGGRARRRQGYYDPFPDDMRDVFEEMDRTEDEKSRLGDARPA